MNAATLLFREALRACGQSVTLVSAQGERTVTAAVQPAGEKREGRLHTPPGLADKRRYLYIGPPEEDLGGVTKLVWRGRAFRVLRAEVWHLGENPHHVWALLEAKGGAE